MSSDYKKEFEDLIAMVIAEGASDLHLSEGREPILRVSGILIPLVKIPALSRVDMKGILDEVLDASKKEIFLAQKEVDFAYDNQKGARFRGNAYFQVNKIS